MATTVYATLLQLILACCSHSLTPLLTNTRTERNEMLMPLIQHVFDENGQVYGVRIEIGSSPIGRASARATAS